MTRGKLTMAALIALAMGASGCSRINHLFGRDSGGDNAQALANAPAAVFPTPTPAPSASPTTAAAAAGFSPATAPVGQEPPGAFPFFGLLQGYAPYDTNLNHDGFVGPNQINANYDHYEFFDGTKLITVEGRLRTVEAVGTGRSFFEAQKNYEKLIHDLGGVTVWEGPGQAMADRHLDFAERRHRNRYGSLPWEKMGVYMLRTPTREIWLEVYNTNDEHPNNYWLTIVEKKTLDVSAQLLPAAAMKAALDTAGHVALYVNFDTDRTAVLPASQPLLANVVQLLNQNPGLKLTIEGHTDNAGTPAHNLTLSQGRANAVMGMLIAQGIDPARLQAHGIGQARPIADNTTDQGRAKNRRVELVRN
ncbi:OmpA family protein [Sphingomonas sp.]|uniref:OmpA family protein n=1 Tax=Sphingomonas sp. TaxID=28214 RepID=UPI003CC66311